MDTVTVEGQRRIAEQQWFGGNDFLLPVPGLKVWSFVAGQAGRCRGLRRLAIDDILPFPDRHPIIDACFMVDRYKYQLAGFA